MINYIIEYAPVVGTVVGIILGMFYLLWILFLAGMNLARAKNDGKLTLATKIFGWPVIIVTVLLDVILNITVMTVVLLEIPRELTISARLQRHNNTTGWRKKVARVFEQFLDPYDPSGDHI